VQAAPESTEEQAAHVPAVPAARRRVADAGLAAVCLGGIAFLFVQILSFSYGRDQGIYAMVGRAVLAGRMPYRDAWDFKPPGIFLVYAFARALFGSSQVGIRVVEVAGLAAMVLALVRLTGQWWGDRRVGLVAGAIAVLVHAQLDFWHTAQPESFGGMLTVFALLAVGPTLDDPASRSRSALRRWVLSGALFGLAGLMKPPLAGGGAVVALALAARAWSSSRSRGKAVRPVAAVLLGGVLPFALCLGWFAARGALHDLYDVLFVFTPHYTKLSWEGETVTGMAYWGFTEWLVTYCSVPTVGLLLMLGFSPRPRERFGVVVVAILIALHIVGVAMQGKFFPYHYGATWPLTALLAALGFIRLWDVAASRGPAGVALFAAGFVVVTLFHSATKDTPDSFLDRCRKRLSLLLDPAADPRVRDQLASVADVNAGANRLVAEALRTRVPAGRHVFVWGFEPVIYDLADRAPATRFLYDVPQRVAWAKDRMRETLMRDLAEGQPAAIVVEHRDVFPVVTGDAIDSADTLARFPELRDRLAAGYRLDLSIEDFDIYLERP
jgi:hypothetical protein